MMNHTNATGSVLTLRVAADNGVPEYAVDIYPPFSSKGWEVLVGRDSTHYATFDRAFDAAKALIVQSQTMVRGVQS